MAHKIYTVDEMSDTITTFDTNKYILLRRSDRETDRQFEEMLIAQNQLVFQSIKTYRQADKQTKKAKEEAAFEENRFFWRIEMQCKYALEELKKRQQKEQRALKRSYEVLHRRPVKGKYSKKMKMDEFDNPSDESEDSDKSDKSEEEEEEDEEEEEEEEDGSPVIRLKSTAGHIPTKPRIKWYEDSAEWENGEPVIKDESDESEEFDDEEEEEEYIDEEEEEEEEVQEVKYEEQLLEEEEGNPEIEYDEDDDDDIQIIDHNQPSTSAGPSTSKAYYNSRGEYKLRT